MKDKIVNSKEMSIIRMRMQEYADFKGLTAYRIERDLDKSKGAWYSYRNPTAEFIYLFCAKYNDLSAEWLLRGIGPMIKGDDSSITITQDNSHQSAHNISNGTGDIHENATQTDIVTRLLEQNAALIEILKNK